MEGIGVFSMLVAFESKILDFIEISVRWASSSFEVDKHGRVGTKLHITAKAFLVLGLMATHVLCEGRSDVSHKDAQFLLYRKGNKVTDHPEVILVLKEFITNPTQAVVIHLMVFKTQRGREIWLVITQGADVMTCGSILMYTLLIRCAKNTLASLTPLMAGGVTAMVFQCPYGIEPSIAELAEVVFTIIMNIFPKHNHFGYVDKDPGNATSMKKVRNRLAPKRQEG